MDIHLSDHFTYKKLLQFSFPSILMMIFTSIYGVIDGVFVSNYAGETAFAAVNIIWPFAQTIGALGFMIGTGGSALVAKILGEGDENKANKIFSMLVYSVAILGIIGAIISLRIIPAILNKYGIVGDLFKECMLYSYILIPAISLFMLQFMFQSFLVVAEKPKLGLIITTVAGVTNVILDILLISVYKMGIVGAGLATVVGQLVGAGIPFIYFMFSKNALIKIVKTSFYKKYFIKACSNGVSEFVANISMSIVGMLYNYQMLKLIGQNGVIAYGIISYVNFIFLSVFFGYAVGTNPIISYNYGAKNSEELHNLFQKNIVLIIIASIFMTMLAELSAEFLARIFISYDENLVSLTANGFRIYSLSFLLAGINIYASAFFTALNNGLLSATISSLRTLVFECACVIILPIYWELNGIWSAIVLAEIFSLVISITFLILNRKKYNY